MGIESGQRDRRVQFLRASVTDDGFQERVGAFAHLGPFVWGARKDVSDVEKMNAGQEQATLMSRFKIRSTGFTRQITPADRLICDGITFGIVGIKECDGRAGLEITAMARAD